MRVGAIRVWLMTLSNEMLSLRPSGKPPFTDPGEGQDDLAIAVALAI